MNYRLLHEMNVYKNVTENFIQNILKSDLLIDGHRKVLLKHWNPTSNKLNGVVRALKFTLKSIKLSTLVLQYLTGDKSTLAPLGTIIPASLHYLILMLKKVKESKYTQTFEKLIMVLHKQYKLISNVDQYHQNKLTSIQNLDCRHVTRTLFRDVVPVMNTILLANGKDIIDVASKINELIKKIDIALCTDEFRQSYEVGFEQIDFSLPNLPPNDACIAFYERCRLSYSLIVSSFLCVIGLGFCYPRKNEVDINCKELLDEILPEALEFICARFEKMSEDFKRTFPSNSHAEAPSQQIAEKVRPIDKALIDLIRKILLTFDVAQSMGVDLQQTECADLGYIIEHYDDVRKIEILLSDCQDMVNCLKGKVRRQVRIEHVEAARHHVQMAQSEAAAVVEEQNISEPAGPVIRHNDPDIPANTEEYSLSVHGSDHESEKELHEMPSTLEYAELLDSVKRQKLIIQELNIELKKQESVTQEEESPDQNKIPMARVLPTKQSTGQRRNVRAAAPSMEQIFAAHLNEPLLGFVPQQNNPLPPLATAFQQAFPQYNFPEPGNVPAPMPNIFNNFNPEDSMPYDAYENLAAQVQGSVNNNNWAGNEEIYQYEPIVEFLQNEQNLNILHNLQNNEPAPPPNDEYFPTNNQ